MDAQPPSPAAASPSPTEPHAVLIELVREIREQRQSFDQSQRLAAAERRSERRWRMLFHALVFGTPVLLGVIYFMFFLSSTGFRWGPFRDVVGVVRVEGAIGANEHASADSIVPALERAFANPNVKAIVLSIDSPGGAPVESERICNAIDVLRKRHPKQVVAVINNIGASAAFMIALHADRIVAGRYSLVGSIGAMMAPWQLDRAIAKVDARQRVYASGKLKAFLNPFMPVTPEVEAKAQRLIDQLGETFVEEVKARRGPRLKNSVDVATGEVWPGAEAVDLGLVDAVGTIEEYVSATWGLQTFDYGPSQQRPGLLGMLGRSLHDALARSVERLAGSMPEVR